MVHPHLAALDVEIVLARRYMSRGISPSGVSFLATGILFSHHPTSHAASRVLISLTQATRADAPGWSLRTYRMTIPF